ncbi:hypothetical protein [Roseisolibacter agri]|uniref:Secreted protein n=1 Tax=Roseisolibacter agri TaxID=2014610 RepID=A0AA37QC72_9BACT|nr:hypothetical protein [Roseisolibacter agri]GLC27061.1 hypothetical protein rosag_35740 [Roseisolibacter agri]
MSIAPRLSWCLGVLAALVVGATRPVGAQTGHQFTLTPSGTAAATIGGTTTPSPLRTHYESGTSATTPTWELVASCPNSVGNASNFCAVGLALGGAGGSPLGAVRVDYTLSGSGCRTPTPAGASYTRTLTSTTRVDLFLVTRGNGSSGQCTASSLRFTVVDMSYTAYRSSASASTYYSRGLDFTIEVR